MMRSRLLVALATVPLVTLLALGADPAPIEKHLAIQKAMVTARQFLEVNMPNEALVALEAEVPNADGNKAFLNLLREAYLSELGRLEKSATPDAARVAQIRRNLNLLGGMAPIPAKPTAPSDAPPVATPVVRPEVPTLPPPSFDLSGADAGAEAAAAFKKGSYAEAAKLFASLPAPAPEQKTAWAYCRIRLAADRLNAPQCDATTAASVATEVADALKLVPQHAELREVGQQVLAAARRKAPGAREPVAGAGLGDVVETASFRVRHYGTREVAEAVSKAAELQRKVIFERWSGPPSGAWAPKCEIVIHPNGEIYAKATNRPAASTGTTTVRLTNGRATERRIDLRADDAAVATNALPRELTHVVLADLFPDKPPPKWAQEGMAILAGTPDEAERYTRTLPRCARDGDWFALAQLLDLKEFPTEKITGFYCQSVSLTDYLIRLGGSERNFTIFLRDVHRYGTSQALKRQYSIDGPQALEQAWKRAALEMGRGQTPP